MKGIAVAAQVFTHPEQINGVQRRPEAIASAATRTSEGDIILLEMQERGRTGGPDDNIPAEANPLVWDEVKLATDSGRIVVAPAGNGLNSGGQNLDSPL